MNVKERAAHIAHMSRSPLTHFGFSGSFIALSNSNRLLSQLVSGESNIQYPTFPCLGNLLRLLNNTLLVTQPTPPTAPPITIANKGKLSPSHKKNALSQFFHVPPLSCVKKIQGSAPGRESIATLCNFSFPPWRWYSCQIAVSNHCPEAYEIVM
jgi:hypothetical protein